MAINPCGFQKLMAINPWGIFKLMAINPCDLSKLMAINPCVYQSHGYQPMWLGLITFKNVKNVLLWKI
jgi:hypothetical protein